VKHEDVEAASRGNVNTEEHRLEERDRMVMVKNKEDKAKNNL